MPYGDPDHGMFFWNELLTRDVARAKKFYSDLIGWKMEDMGMPGMPETTYTLGKVSGRSVAGMMKMPPDVPAQVPSHWVSYIAVDDVDATFRKAKQLGAKPLVEPQDVPDIGRFCVIEDPYGAVVAFMTAKK